MPHRMNLTVRFYELDPYNHLNHASYIQYFEVARIRLLDEVGFGLLELAERGFQIVVTDLHTRFLKAGSYGDRLVVETEVVEVRRASSRWRQRLLRGDEVMAEQEIGAAMINEHGRPVRLPDDFAEALRPYVGS